MKKNLWLLILFMTIGCSPTVWFPPEIDLIPYEQIGLISFSIENAEGQLDEMATQIFLEEITRFQRGVQVVELGTLDQVLSKINKESLDQDAVLAIGENFGLTAFFHGKIKVSDVKPQVDISFLMRSMNVQASFNISATSRLFSTETGATLWTDSAFRNAALAYLSIQQGGIPFFDVRDQDEAYRRLVERLIHELTRDFRPTKGRVKRR